MGSSLLWRHNEHDGVSNHQPHECLLSLPSRRRSKKTSKLRVTSLGAGNSPETGEFPAKIASNTENVTIWWRHHVMSCKESNNLCTVVTNCLSAYSRVTLVFITNDERLFYYTNISLSRAHKQFSTPTHTLSSMNSTKDVLHLSPNHTYNRNVGVVLLLLLLSLYMSLKKMTSYDYVF